MSSLLIKILMVNLVCPPLLSVLIPGSIAVTVLLFSLDLNPLEHFDPPHESDALVNRHRKMPIFDRCISVTLA